MSNHLAIAHVLAAIRYRLESEFSLTAAISGAGVDFGPPEEPAAVSSPRIRLFAYQVTPNASLRNADTPTRTSTGAALVRPAAAVDVHFLLSCYGDASKLEPERLMGYALGILSAYPSFSAAKLVSAAAAFDAAVSETVLVPSDLDRQPDGVVVTVVPMNLEELNRLWGTVTQTGYVLSTAWRASVLQLERPVVQRIPLPVRSVGLASAIFGGPTIDAVANQTAGAPIAYQSTIVLTGRGLRATGTTQLRIGTTTFSLHPTADAVTPTQVTLDLSAHGPGAHSAGLSAGFYPLRVVHPSFVSNAVPLIVVPSIATGASAPAYADDTVTVHVYPAVGAAQNTRLHLSRSVDGVATQYSLAEVVASRVAGTPSTVVFAVPGDVDLGTTGDRWIVRVEVDGVFSVPELDETSGVFASPALEVP